MPRKHKGSAKVHAETAHYSMTEWTYSKKWNMHKLKVNGWSNSFTAYLCLPNLNLIVQLNLVLSSKEDGCCKGTKTLRINNSR